MANYPMWCKDELCSLFNKQNPHNRKTMLEKLESTHINGSFNIIKFLQSHLLIKSIHQNSYLAGDFYIDAH